MQTLTLASAKGGTGKTSLAASLAVAAILKGRRVAILDIDPQQSLARWHEWRSNETGVSDSPALFEAGRFVDRALAKVADKGFDLAIIDTPPGSMRHAVAGIEVADLTVIPVRPSPIDVEAVDVMAELCREHSKDWCFVLNATAPRAHEMAAGARQYLAARGDVLDAEVANRVAYAAGMMLGGTAVEKDKGAKAEIAALWIALEKRLARAAKLARTTP